MRSLLVCSCLVCFLYPFLVKSLNTTLSDDVLGLIFFKSDINDPLRRLDSWNEDDGTPCSWNGVKCDNTTNRVSEVVLDHYGLTGRIGTGLLRLPFLKRLSLANNYLAGNLTLNFSQLPNLEFLNLSGNGLSGLIPSSFFSKCWALKSISLDRNSFSGTIPETLSSCSALASVNISGNRFSGDIPNEIGSCTLLTSIDLSRNMLSGGLPSSMQKLSSCRELVLGGNAFQSNIPEWIESMRELEILDISDNKFAGQIPYSLGNLQSLKTLNVSKNDLTGILPTWVFGLGLEQVLLSENGLRGTLDRAFDSSTEDSLKKLSVLNLSGNKFSGEIPEIIGQFKNLSVLDLSNNRLNGSLPLSIGDCYSLKTLYLSSNKIRGGIPSSLANISYLQIVDLSFNKLTGKLPRRLSELQNLLVFNISHNQLQGELPSSGFFNTIDSSSLTENTGLCGAQVNNNCNSKDLPKPIVLNPNDTDPTTPNAIDSSPSFHRGKKVLSVSALIAIGAGISIVVGVIFITVLNFSVGPTGSRTVVDLDLSGSIGYDDISRSPSSHRSSGKLVMFSSGDLDPEFATSGPLLSKDSEIGRGGFGSVYRARLGDGRQVAIKKLAASSLVKSQEEFERGMKKLGKARHHMNVVPLEGYYWTSSLQLLIYEFATGGSLYRRLHEVGSGESQLSWNERFGIVLGIARGVAHLHRTGVIHYNLKSSNVLIDGSGEAKVGDYGLAQLVSSKIQSALGYVAPEFAFKNVRITEKCDVFGFGSLVLEIVSGKRPIEYMEDDVVVLCDMVRGALEEGRVEECLEGDFPAEEAIPVVKLGLICTSPVPSSRPDMAEVVNILELIRGPRDDDSGEFSIDF